MARQSIKDQLAIWRTRQRGDPDAATKSTQAPAQLLDIRQIVEYLFGFLVFGAFCVTCMWSATFVNRLLVYCNRDKYVPATFVVTGSQYDDDDSDASWLTGYIGESSENFAPLQTASKTPSVERYLFVRYPVGTKIQVLYNSAATTTICQGETLRVLAATPDIWQREAGFRHQLGLRLLLLLPGTLAVRWLVIKLVKRRACRVGPQDKQKQGA